LEPAAPAIVSQPISRSIVAGSTATFAVTASGTQPLNYQWIKNGQVLNDGGNASGATTASLSLNNVQDADAASYTVVVANTLGSATSAPALLTALDPPTITIQPASPFQIVGTTASFTVVSGGTMPLNYRWRKNGVDLSDGGKISGATYATLTLSNVQFLDGGNYSVLVSNVVGITTSSNASLTVLPSTNGFLWNVDFQGSGGKVGFAAIGQTANDFWNYYSRDLQGSSGAIVNLAMADKTITPVGLAVDNGRGVACSGSYDPMYDCYIYSGYQTSLTITVTNLPTGSYRVLVYSPQGVVSLSVGGFAYGNRGCYDSTPVGVPVWTEGVQYAQYTGVPVTNGQSMILVMHPVGPNLYGKLAGLQIMQLAPIPSIVQQPENELVISGGSASFTVLAGGAQLNYQWKKNGSDLTDGGNISGANSPTLTLNAVSGSDAAGYSVLVSNSYGAILSSNAILMLLYGSGIVPIVPWGNNSFGQTNVPRELTNVLSISSGADGYHVLALKTDHTVVAWGNDDWGQTDVPAGLTNVAAIAAGAVHSLALQAGGGVVAWGYNGSGQTSVPTDLTNAVGVAAGYGHSMALRADRTVVAWGDNSSGQSAVPTGLTNVIAVAAGNNDSLALKADGTVVAWGNNDYGQTDVPAGLTNVVAIAAGDSHNLALKADGTVLGWGWNGEGETEVPAAVSNAVAVAAGYDHSLALEADGTVVAWGWDNQGQTDVPASLGSVVAIAAGDEFSLALVDLGSPVILKQPANQTVNLGATALLSVAVVGVQPLSYRWQKEGVNLIDGGNVSGSATARFVLSDVQDVDTADYTVITTNTVGSVTSSPAILTVLSPPAITSQPIGQLLAPGCSTVLGVVAAGTPPLIYKWWKDGSALDGQTNANLFLNNIQISNFGNYRIVVTNGYGSTTSSNAALVQDQLPIAGPDTVQRPATGGVKINVAVLLANDIDADGDGLTIVGVSSMSTAGGTVYLKGNWVYYIPLAGFTNTDTYRYTVSDGHCGGEAVGVVAVLVESDVAQSGNFTIQRQSDGSILLRFNGIPGFTYQIQYTESLSNPNWQDLGTQTADGLGVYQFNDYPPANAPARFYRSVWP
jgi:alpha-tubulin suppressor-like RCC1 family protein